MSLTSFTDAAGREWDLTINLGVAKRIDASDFTNLTTEQLCFVTPNKRTFGMLLRSDALLFAVIWVVIQKQLAKKAKAGEFPIDPNTNYDEAELEFVESIEGETKTLAREAFWRSLGNFFPEHQTVLSTLMQQYKKATEKLATKIASLEPEVEALLEMELDDAVETLREKLKASRTKPGVTSGL